MPGLLGSRIHFKKQFSDPVEHGQRHTATKRELATGRKAMQRLARKMSGWFLRRTKTLIKDQLPKKEDRVRTAFVYIRNSLSCFIYSENTSFDLHKSLSSHVNCLSPPQLSHRDISQCKTFTAFH